MTATRDAAPVIRMVRSVARAELTALGSVDPYPPTRHALCAARCHRLKWRLVVPRAAGAVDPSGVRAIGSRDVP